MGHIITILCKNGEKVFLILGKQFLDKVLIKVLKICGDFYLSYCEAGFNKSKNIDLVQISFCNK